MTEQEGTLTNLKLIDGGKLTGNPPYQLQHVSRRHHERLGSYPCLSLRSCIRDAV
jgi:hypothetical protein